jgi:short-subunit dehydrogenase
LGEQEACGGDGAGVRIVNLGSLAGKEGLAKLAAYSAASAGVISFTKALGREIADTNIHWEKGGSVWRGSSFCAQQH